MSNAKTILFVDSSLSRIVVEQLSLVNKLLDDGCRVVIVGNDDIATLIENETDFFRKSQNTINL